jgi:hypothetical protein
MLKPADQSARCGDEELLDVLAGFEITLHWTTPSAT